MIHRACGPGFVAVATATGRSSHDTLLRLTLPRGPANHKSLQFSHMGGVDGGVISSLPANHKSDLSNPTIPRSIAVIITTAPPSVQSIFSLTLRAGVAVG